jgi:hypothetical protein
MAARKRANNAAARATNEPLLQELDTLKRLLLLQLVASGVKPIDIALTLGVAKSAISGLVPVRKLSLSKRVADEASLAVQAATVVKRLDTLIALARKSQQ